MSEWASVHADRFSGANDDDADDDDNTVACYSCGARVLGWHTRMVLLDGELQIVCLACNDAHRAALDAAFEAVAAKYWAEHPKTTEGKA